MKLFVTTIKPGGLKSVDIPKKIKACQYSWIRRLYGNFFHEWKLIPLYLIKKSFCTSFKFDCNLLLTDKTKIFSILLQVIYFGLEKTCCNDNSYTFLHFVSIFVAQ